MTVRKSLLWVIAVMGIGLLLADIAVAQRGPGQRGPGQRGPGQRGFGQRGFGGFGGTSALELLRREDVRKDLELLDEQVKQVEALSEKSRGDTRNLFSGLRDLSADERRAKFEQLREQMASRNKDLEKQVNSKILLPHQSKRLKQIQFQMSMRRFGGSSSFTSQTVVEALGISDEQKAKLEEAQKQADEQLRKQIEQLREQARQQLLNQLTPQQRAKYKELVGEPFQASTTQRRFGGFGGRQGGGFGGARPGGPGGNQRPQRPQRPGN